MKLRQEVYKNDTLRKATDYIGSLILENDTLQFIQTAEGRVVPKTVDGVDKNEYQYHLKDHLGNVRTTFTTKPKEEVYTTSFETTSVPEGYFDNYEDQHLSSYLARTGNNSSRLSYDDNLLIGLAKSIKVYPGDTVRASVFARVIDSSTEDISDLFATLASGFSSSFANTTLGIEGQTTSISDLVYPTSGTGGLLDKDDSDATPKLYLNLLYFDKDMNFIAGDFARASTEAVTSFEELSFEELVPVEGYMLIYVSNEEDQKNIAYFDDVSIEHSHSPVLQADDYYPFGLTFNSYQRSYSKANNYKYNGFEEQVEWGVYDYQARYYDPALGRFLNVDPAADLMRRHSPYNYAFDNPIRFIDPDGLMPSDVVRDENCCPDSKDVGEGFLELIKMIFLPFTGPGNGKDDQKKADDDKYNIDELITGDEQYDIGNENDKIKEGIILEGQTVSEDKDLTRAENTETLNSDTDEDLFDKPDVYYSKYIYTPKAILGYNSNGEKDTLITSMNQYGNIGGKVKGATQEQKDSVKSKKEKLILFNIKSN